MLQPTPHLNSIDLSTHTFDRSSLTPVPGFGLVDMRRASGCVTALDLESRTNVKMTLEHIHRLVHGLRAPFGITQAHWLTDVPRPYLHYLTKTGRALVHFPPIAQEQICALSSHAEYSRLRQRGRMRGSVAPIDEDAFDKSVLGPEIRAAIISDVLRRSAEI